MLMFAFITAVFSSASWLIYAILFVRSKLEAEGLWAQSPEMMLTLLTTIFVPLLVIWMIFGYINQFLANRAVNRKQGELLTQLQKNQDYTDLVVRVMLDAEHEIKDGFVINKFEVLMSDMNEALSEIIQRCNIASSNQLEVLWQKVGRGERWALGKAVLEASKNQSTFSSWVREKVNRDKLFRGTLLEFCSRYQNLLQLLEKHDRDRVFLRMIEMGVIGKVYSIIAPLADGLQNTNETLSARLAPEKAPEKDYTTVLKLATMQEPEAQNTIMNVDRNDEEEMVDEADDEAEEYYDENEEYDEPRPSFLRRFKLFGRREEEDEPSLADEDPFFKALHNSFRGENGNSDHADFTPSEPSVGGAPSVSGEPRMEREPRVEREPSVGSVPSVGGAPHFDRLFAHDKEPRMDSGWRLATDNSDAPEEPAEPVFTANAANDILTTQHSEVEPENESEPEMAEVEDIRYEDLRAVEPDMTPTPQSTTATGKNTAEDDEDLVYPFGGWTNEDNYQK